MDYPILHDPLINRRQPQGNALIGWGARLILRLIGWRVTGEIPDIPKAVVIAAPHTSYMDGFLMLMVAFGYRVRLHWMVKVELTHGLIGIFMRGIGAIGVDRTGNSTQNLVQRVIEMIHERERVFISVPPEGTRQYTDHWRTGFYWIAYGAGIPIIAARMDYSKRRIDLSFPALYPSGDIDADMEKIRPYFENVAGRHPERVGRMFIRASGKRNMANTESHPRMKRTETTTEEQAS